MFKNNKNKEISNQLELIDKKISKIESDIKKLKKIIDNIMNIDTKVVLNNDEELWRREKRKKENGF